SMYKPLLIALSFLWRIPITPIQTTEKDFQKALPLFPLVGALEGFLISLIGYFLAPLILPEFLAIVILLILFYMRGIFHLDGLSDTFDALSYHGGVDSEEAKAIRLKIMKDSTIGVAGVTAIVINLLAKYALIKEILLYNPLSLIWVFFLSRGFLLWCIFYSIPAKPEGLGYLMKKNLTKKGFLLGNTFCVLLTCLLLLSPFKVSLLAFFFLIFLNFFVLFYFKSKFEKAFGGLTGDNLGALIEISELITLFYLGVIWPKL
ncbi:MAG: adenosylcobinamide-GDP ribazoletransferase, partial [Caldimicrobium sp.]